MSTDGPSPVLIAHRRTLPPSLVTLTIGTTAAASYWLGWDVGALLAVEAMTGIGLALTDGELDDEISSI